MVSEANTERTSARPGLVLVPLLVGCAVAVALGAYGRIHQPTGQAIFTLGFSGMINMKVWLATIAAALGLFQLGSALRIFRVYGSGDAPKWLRTAHRISGALAVTVSAPVAFHCLWAIGLSDFDARTLAHSLLGCGFYGAFVAKMLTLHMRGLPGWALPLFGGLTFTALVSLWFTSAFWFFQNVGFPQF
ncbi:MAG: hypothetical protein ICV70_07995 [Jiangellaceae bacterium]|nr:hypothetical protein [Jiangellaceae bacterium]